MKRLRFSLQHVALASVVLLLSVASAAGAAGPPRLIESLVTGNAGMPAANSAQGAPVALNPSAFLEPQFELPVGQSVILATRDGAITWRGDGFSVSLTLPAGYGSITVHRGIAAGVFATGPAIYELQPRADGTYVLSSPPARPLVCTPITLHEPARTPTVRTTTHPRAVAHPGFERYVISVAEYFYPAARDAAGGATQIEAVIRSKIDFANLVFKRSGAGNISLDLVLIGPAPFEETGDPDADLLRLASDPVVAAERKAVHAHLVGLFFEHGSNYDGLAYRPIGAFYRNLGFHVVRRASDPITYAHEIVHNLGGDHNEEKALLPRAEDPHPFARGYWDSVGLFTDIMTTSAGLYCGWCGRIPYVSTSNTSVTYEGRPLGNTDCDNVRMMQIGAAEVTKY